MLHIITLIHSELKSNLEIPFKALQAYTFFKF